VWTFLGHKNGDRLMRPNLPLTPIAGTDQLAEFWERPCSRCLIYFLPETTANSYENTSPTFPKNVKSVKAERA
jgi:hypothetical protein